MPNQLIPYIPVAPERQPQGGLLQGLEDNLARMRKQNDLRKQMQVKEEFDIRDDERRSKQALMMERERTAGELAKEEQKNEIAQRNQQIVEEILQTRVVDPSKREAYSKEMARRGIRSLGRVPGVKGAASALGFDTPQIRNIIGLNQPEKPLESFTIPLGEAFAKSRSLEEFSRDHPAEFSKLNSSEWGRGYLKGKPPSVSTGFEKMTPSLYTQIRLNSAAFDDATIDAMEGLAPQVKTALKLYAENARIADTAKAEAEAGRISAAEAAKLKKDQIDDIQGRSKEARKKAEEERDEYWENIKDRPTRRMKVDNEIIELDDDEYKIEVEKWTARNAALMSSAKSNETIANELGRQAMELQYGGKAPPFTTPGAVKKDGYEVTDYSKMSDDDIKKQLGIP